MKKINDWEWIDCEETGSTNDDAKDLTLGTKGHKYIVTAQRQNSGRGRRGRDWVSLDGNLFMSMAIQADLKDLGQIIFVVSLSLLEAIRTLFPKIKASLKWPNDILVNERKVSGILLEKGEGDYLVIGIGVNVTASPKIEGLIYPAISLAEAGYDTDRLSLLYEYIKVFDANYEIWQTKGFREIKQRWLADVKSLGEKIKVHTVKEDKIGYFKGVDDNGILLLDIDGQVEKIYAGDIFYL